MSNIKDITVSCDNGIINTTDTHVVKKKIYKLVEKGLRFIELF